MKTTTNRHVPPPGYVLLACLIGLFCSQAIAQDSAPSSHMVFDDNFPGDILINEVRVPTSGEALYTYYETLGWRGKGGGYAGIQAHPKAHLYIFSIWDNQAHTAPIKAVYVGAKTKTERFGGEGTGLKSWNFDLGWSNNVWYTLVARSWHVDQHTHFGFWVRDSETKIWTHLVTMDVACKTSFEARTDAFIEDWRATGSHSRTTHLRGGWKRKLDGTWHAFSQCRYSVNRWDLTKGKRSYNFRKNWDGGIRADDKGKHYFMVSGGKETMPSTDNPSVFKIERNEHEPAYDPIRIVNATAKRSGDQVTVSWKLDPTSLPMFGHELKLIDASTNELVYQSKLRSPHTRETKFDLPAGKSGELRLEIVCTDILDHQTRHNVLIE